MKMINTTSNADLPNINLPNTDLTSANLTRADLICDKLPESEQKQTAYELKTWSLYIIEDKHGHFYTGITTDVQARFLRHQSGKGAKALQGKLPLKLIYHCVVGDRSLASQYEYRVKQLSKLQKKVLVQSNQSVIDFFFRI